MLRVSIHSNSAGASPLVLEDVLDPSCMGIGPPIPIPAPAATSGKLTAGAPWSLDAYSIFINKSNLALYRHDFSISFYKRFHQVWLTRAWYLPVSGQPQVLYEALQTALCYVFAERDVFQALAPLFGELDSDVQ